MKLRSILLPPAPDAAKVAELVRIANEIEDCVYTGRDERELLARFNRETPRFYDTSHLLAMADVDSAESFIEQTLTPDGPFVPDLTPEEALELVRRVGYSEFGEHKDYEVRYWREVLHRSVRGYVDYDAPTPQEALQRAADCKPIAL